MNSLVRRAGAQPVDLPGPSEREELALAVQTIGSVFGELVKASMILLEESELQSAITRVQMLLENDGANRLSLAIATLQRPATKKEVSVNIAGLIAAFPNAGKLDSAFAKILCEDVGAAKPSIGALETATRKLRRTWRPDFGRSQPSIAEILEEMQKAESDLSGKEGTLSQLPSLIAKAQKILERLIREREHQVRRDALASHRTDETLSPAAAPLTHAAVPQANGLGEKLSSKEE